LSDMSIAATGAATGAGQSGSGAAASTGAPGGALGENAFLQLLVAQLKYQDPMQPVDSTQFVTQLAQFQMLTEITSMKQDLDALVAAQASKSASGTAATPTKQSGSS